MRLYSVFRFVLAIVSIFLSVGLVRSIWGHWHKQDVVVERQETLRAEQQRQKNLVRQLEEATSSAFIEKQARDKLGLVKPGDTIVLLDTTSIAQKDEARDPVRSASGWRAWWELFF
jgi:cell division protein FtsB